jgi:hypothetical protein
MLCKILGLNMFENKWMRVNLGKKQKGGVNYAVRS